MKLLMLSVSTFYVQGISNPNGKGKVVPVLY